MLAVPLAIIYILLTSTKNIEYLGIDHNVTWGNVFYFHLRRYIFKALDNLSKTKKALIVRSLFDEETLFKVSI